MRSIIDFSSWHSGLTTLLGIVLVSLVAVGIRLVFMQTMQQRRERANRQINERLKTLIAAYKTLGGSFTGDLAVDPSHLRELRTLQDAQDEPAESAGANSERRRRIRDAVEAALSDVILLGTADQVRLAAQAASDMVAGRNVETAELVVSLRSFIREVLDLEAIPAEVLVPKQGPLRPAGTAQRGNRGPQPAGAAREGGTRGGGGGGAGAGAGGVVVGAGAGAGALQGLDGVSRPDGLDTPGS